MTSKKQQARLSHQETRERASKIVEQLCKGSDPSVVAREFKLTKLQVSRIAYNNGLRTRGIAHKPKLRVFELLAALQDSEQSMEAISEKYGCTRQYVSEVYRQATAAGLKLPERTQGHRIGA